MTRIRLGFPAVLLLLAVPGVPALLAQERPSTVIQRVLVKVNGEPFTQKDLEERQIEFLQQTGQGNLQGDELNRVVAQIMPELIVSAVDELLLLQRGREAGYSLSDAQFGEMLENIKADNNMNDAQFQAALDQEGLTLTQLRERLNRSFIIREVQQRDVLGQLSLTQQELRQYYQQHPDEFVTPPSVTLREIFILVPQPEGRGGQPQLFAPAAAQAAEAKIKALHERAVQGQDFEALVAEESEGASKASGGLIGPIDVSELATGIREALESMEPGDITPPIRSPRGFQILKLEARTGAEPRPFDDVRDEIAQSVGESRLDVETATYLRTLRTQAFLDWKRDDLRLMYEQRLAEIAAASPGTP
jgi:peptidyl-prolyl cis-trans isomerase SurA